MRPRPGPGPWLLALLAGAPPASGVLRYPDGSFELRFPLHLDECGPAPLPPTSESRACLLSLRGNLLEDADCGRVICDNIHTSTPIEVYANQSDWIPFKNLCGNLQELFLNIFDLGMALLGRPATPQDERHFVGYWEVFMAASIAWFEPEAPDAPAYANTTRSVLRRHAAELLEWAGQASSLMTADSVLALAVRAARRLQLLIENISVTLLLNFHLAQLEYNGRVSRGQNLIHELYGDVSLVRVVFHEIPGKRWDALSHLLDKLGISHKSLAMAEIGVEAANTSQRLLERNRRLSYIGVDPYIGNDALYEDVVVRLAEHMSAGRFVLHRNTSVRASELVPEYSLDLVFLDARHDYEAVAADVVAWRPKVRPGGILSGHDFSWMFPTVAMAVYSAAFDAPERTIHLAPDGVWWLQL